MNNMGAASAANFKAFDINKLVWRTLAGTETVLGSIKNWKRNYNEERLVEPDNSPKPADIVDIKTKTTVEFTFDLDEHSTANLAIIVGHAADANGRYYLSSYDGSVGGLYAYGKDLQNGSFMCYGIPKGRLRGQLMHGEGTGPQVRKWTCTMRALSDTDGTYGAPTDDDGEPVLDFYSPVADSDEYGYSA